VLVVGAGALGNEIIKNLALLGVGNVLIADLDAIEHSNLSRSVLYRERDIGKPKASVAADAARELFPEINAHAFVGDAINGLGAGAYRWADVIIGGLDNRECRLHVNRQAWRFGKSWVDGAIEQIQGVARVFSPDAAQTSPCYECTLSRRDWELLAQRRSCNMLTREQMSAGRTPTTPTISAIIAGIQTQEAVKLIHGLDSLAGRGITFIGATAETFPVDYQRREDCLNHETLSEIVSLEAGTADLTLGELLGEARSLLGENATIELGRDVIERFDCPTCGKSEPVFAALGTVRAGRAICSCDGVTVRVPILFHSIRGDESFLNRRLADVGVPAFDVLTARAGDRTIGLELAGDASAVLGPLHSGGLSWT
jgi:adenylyltransferase/sulfurtransferase